MLTVFIILYTFHTTVSQNKSYKFDTSIDYLSLISLKFTRNKKITQLRVNTQLKTSFFNLLDISDFIDSCSSHNNYTYICNSSIYYTKEESSSSYFFFLNKKMVYSSDNRDYDSPMITYHTHSLSNYTKVIKYQRGSSPLKIKSFA